MPMVRARKAAIRCPYIYEIYFEQHGEKAISYIGKSTGLNSNYVSGSSELNRVIANTALCFGEREAELGWHKLVLAEFPVGTPENVLEQEEKKFILASYEESKRLGPGRNWEILNKSHLGDVWSESARPVMARLRAGSGGDAMFKALSSGSNRYETNEYFPVCADTEVNNPKNNRFQVVKNEPLRLEANFFKNAALKLGSQVPVILKLMAMPGQKRMEVKARVFLMVLRALELRSRESGCEILIKNSTLSYLLKEPNLSPGQSRALISQLAETISMAGLGRLTLNYVEKGEISFWCNLTFENSDLAAVAWVDYQRFIEVASSGRHAASGRRYFAVIAADQYFRKCGKGIPWKLALPIITGKQPPDDGDSKRWAELQSTCSKAIKQSDAFLRRMTGTTIATNYFTKKMLREVEPRFSSRADDFRVIQDNAETTFTDFYALLAE